MFANFPVLNWLVVFGLGFLGVIAIQPYLLHSKLVEKAREKMPLRTLLLVSILQTAILILITSFVGMLIAPKIGLGTPVIQAALAGQPVGPVLAHFWVLALILGVGSTALMLVLEFEYFRPRLPQALREMDAQMSVGPRFLAIFYGGFTEEILLRWFFMSLLAWLIGMVWKTPAGLPTAGAFWLANVLAAVLFGLGHLPATKSLAPLTPTIVFRAILLNGMFGIVGGWLFWQYGLEAAMLAHMSADVVIHVISPEFAKKGETEARLA